jgi:alkanesulfonate monooxygenase SsuD/methylene tetrahydromethanopterin reductase-like flavin-dependent oxidoreductase (luciferase family)
VRIEFGIFDHVEAKTDKPIEQVYEERIATLKRAEEGGFHAFHLAEHHGHPLSASPTAAVFLAAVARETTHLKLIPTVVCLPLHNPVRLFEDLVMVDVLSHGRLELGIGKGITPFEHLQFGHEPDEASERAREIETMLLRAWETGIISSEGSKYYDFLELKLPFESRQKPHPPLWTAGNVEAAGRGGHHFIHPYTMTPEVRKRYDTLWAASRKETGHHNPHVAEPRVAQSQGVIIADTDADAERLGRAIWAGYAESLMRAHGRIPPHLQSAVPDVMDNPIARAQLTRDPMEASLIVTGTVATVRDYYVEQARRGLANYFMVMLPFGSMTSEQADTVLSAFINEIIPAVREAELSLAGATRP